MGKLTVKKKGERPKNPGDQQGSGPRRGVLSLGLALRARRLYSREDRARFTRDARKT